MQRIVVSSLILLAVACGEPPKNSSVLRQEGGSDRSLDPQSETSGKVHQLTVEGDIDNLIYVRERTVFDDDDPIMFYKTPEVPVKISSDLGPLVGTMRPRGQTTFCDSFPQLKLKLDKKSNIEGERKFKLVTGGTYQLTRAIKGCSDDDSIPEFKDQRLVKKRQGDLYDMSVALLDYHLHNIKVDIRYKDSAHGIDFQDRGYLLEDVEAAAERYKMSPAVFTGVSARTTWRIDRFNTLEEKYDDVKYQAEFEYIRDLYHRLKKEHKDWSDVQLTQETDRLVTVSPDKEALEKAMNDSLANKDAIVGSLKEIQQGYLKKFNAKSLAQILIFNEMIGNSDSNVFGITGHSNPIKNVEILVDSNGTYYALPYDFDLTSWAQGPENHYKVFTKDEYVVNMNEMLEDLRTNDNDFLIPAVKEEIAVFIERLSDKERIKAFQADYGDRIKVFVEALKEMSVKETR